MLIGSTMQAHAIGFGISIGDLGLGNLIVSSLAGSCEEASEFSAFQDKLFSV